MGATTGLAVIGAYLGDGGDVSKLLALIPNPDAAHGTGAVAGAAQTPVGAGFLDEMSAPAAAQLRVELAAINTAVGNAEGYRVGSSTMSAGEVTATLKDIVTGLSNLTIADCIVKITRSGVDVTRDAVITEPTAGTIRVAAGANYVMTAGDIVRYYAE